MLGREVIAVPLRPHLGRSAAATSSPTSRRGSGDLECPRRHHPARVRDHVHVLDRDAAEAPSAACGEKKKKRCRPPVGHARPPNQRRRVGRSRPLSPYILMGTKFWAGSPPGWGAVLSCSAASACPILKRSRSESPMPTRIRLVNGIVSFAGRAISPCGAPCASRRARRARLHQSLRRPTPHSPCEQSAHAVREILAARDPRLGAAKGPARAPPHSHATIASEVLVGTHATARGPRLTSGRSPSARAAP